MFMPDIVPCQEPISGGPAPPFRGVFSTGGQFGKRLISIAASRSNSAQTSDMRPEITILPAVCGASPYSWTLSTFSRWVFLGMGLTAAIVQAEGRLARMGKGRSNARVGKADLEGTKPGRCLKRPERVRSAIPM